MRAVALPLLLSPLLTCQLVSAADRAREAQITAAPDPRQLLARQNFQCPSTDTACPDGNGCCPSSEPCITRADGALGCGGGCNGGDICPDGGCCDIGNVCTLSAGNYFCATMGGPAFSLPPITVGSISMSGPPNVGPTPISFSIGGAGSSAMVPSQMPGSSSSAPGGAGAGSSSAMGPTETAGGSSPGGAGTGSGGETSPPAAPTPSPSGNSGLRVHVPVVSWLAVLFGAFL